MTLEEATQRALAAWQAGDLPQVERLCRGILQAKPDAFDALHLLGMLALHLGRPADAVPLFSRAAALRPASVEAHYNHGLALNGVGRNDEALAAYTRVIAMRPGFAEAYNNRGVAYRDLGRNVEALADYDRAVGIDPAAGRAHNNRGVVLREMRRLEEALASYDRAIAAMPDFAQAHSNRGGVLADLGRHAEALASQERAIAIAPGLADAWVRRGVAQADLGNHAAAVASFGRALEIDPRLDWVQGVWLHAKMRVCDWHGLAAALARLRERVERGERAIAPFALLALCDDPALHRKAAQAWARTHAAMPPLSPAPVPRSKTARLHIGYFSADFHEHATAYLMAGMLEQHDRDAVEVTAFSFGPRTADAMQARIASAVERFVDVRDRSDGEVVRLARELGVDIAVDLKGYTDHARSGIFAMRAAPIQVSYLGYPGTLAAPFMDAIIADRVVLPEAAQSDYSERVVYAPGCYQVNDARRAVEASIGARAQHGLPDAGFVFCCFNNAYKIVPETFDSWMRVLDRVPGSVLWLLADDALAAQNLRDETRQRGIDPGRLVFADRRPQAAHMARYRLADLFLDTFPYNAHTTASDALWSGLPLVTRMGVSFAARVAASLLEALGLPELVAQAAEDYEAIAIRLANEPGVLADIRERLERQRTASPLFDPKAHARHLEAAYRALLEAR